MIRDIAMEEEKSHGDYEYSFIKAWLIYTIVVATFMINSYATMMISNSMYDFAHLDSIFFFWQQKIRILPKYCSWNLDFVVNPIGVQFSQRVQDIFYLFFEQNWTDLVLLFNLSEHFSQEWFSSPLHRSLHIPQFSLDTI